MSLQQLWSLKNNCLFAGLQGFSRQDDRETSSTQGNNIHDSLWAKSCSTDCSALKQKHPGLLSQPFQQFSSGWKALASTDKWRVFTPAPRMRHTTDVLTAKQQFSHLNRFFYFHFPFSLKNRQEHFVTYCPVQNRLWTTPQTLLKAICHHLVGQELLLRSPRKSTFPSSSSALQDWKLYGHVSLYSKHYGKASTSSVPACVSERLLQKILL